jgi:hypothetical protein
VEIDRVEIKDVALPETMKRSMSRQAEAERERRSRVITADGEFQASRKLASAADVMATSPAALQLRLLQTIVEVAAEKNSTVVLPFPVELLRFLENATPAADAAPTAAADTARSGGGASTYRHRTVPTRPHQVTGTGGHPTTVPSIASAYSAAQHPRHRIPAAAKSAARPRGSGVPSRADAMGGRAAT